ncbi:MAG TPA: CPBP family intramembrane glutamic endopeptidase [Candidatus Acidoferrales bacterium]|nr:CPBP family intramembrane glutamic endopeptidase [Candidatus Acidoferrales bacterium]
MVTAASGPRSDSAPVGALFQFFFLAFALMWVCFFSVALVPIRTGTVLGQSLLLLGAFAPALAALFLTLRIEGRRGLGTLLRGVIKWRVAAHWYLFAVGFTVIVRLTAAILQRVALGAWPHFDAKPYFIIPFAILFSTPFQAGEEIGWRGYALPRLAEHLGLPRASVLLGVIWGCWHLPQFFIRESDAYQQSFWVFVLGVTALSVILAWLWRRAGGSLLLTMLFHAAWNNSKDVVASGAGGTGTFGFRASFVSWATLAVLWICAAYLLFDMSTNAHRAITPH